MSVTVYVDQLRDLGAALAQAHHVPAAHAELLADTLVQAELWGHSSHGMLRLPWYLDRVRSGAMTTQTCPTTVTDTGSVVVLDGHDGMGQVLTQHAVDLGVQRARAHGISGVAVRNSNHFGMAAYYTRAAAEQGCVSLLFTNASPAMAPWGGKAKTIGTNPWSIAAPAGDRGVVVIDLANTAVARGKLYLAAERGEAIPQTWAADSDGVPTTDPLAGIEGLILPMAGPKGYVISFMVDVLAGVLTGSAFGADVVGPYVPDTRSGAGHLVVTLDVAAFTDPADFGHRMDQLVEATKATERASGVEEIFVPGELEDRTAQARRAGIALPQTTVDSLTRLATEFGVSLPPALTTNRDNTKEPTS